MKAKKAINNDDTLPIFEKRFILLLVNEIEETSTIIYLTDSSQEMVKFIRELKKGDFFKEFTLEVLHIVLFDEETDVKLTTIADHLHPDDDAPETMVYYLEERFGIDYLNATKGE